MEHWAEFAHVTATFFQTGDHLWAPYEDEGEDPDDDYWWAGGFVWWWQAAGHSDIRQVCVDGLLTCDAVRFQITPLGGSGRTRTHPHDAPGLLGWEQNGNGVDSWQGWASDLRILAGDSPAPHAEQGRVWCKDFVALIGCEAGWQDFGSDGREWDCSTWVVGIVEGTAERNGDGTVKLRRTLEAWEG